VFVSRFAICCALVLSPMLATAQDTASDSIPFRRHQWAAQFAGGTTFASLGALRFTAPDRAWLLDFRFTGGHSHDRAYASDTVVSDGFNSNASVDTRIGRRFYQGRGKSVVSFQTVGALGGYTHACQETTAPVAAGSCSNGWRAGVFGEFGAAYLITRRFSIGGSATVAFTYQRTKGTGSSGVVIREWAYQGSVQGLSFAATVYF
jgi:hypothetical protein